MRIGIIAMFLNMVMNIVFYLNGMAHVGLALATSIAVFVNAGLLFFGLIKEKFFSFSIRLDSILDPIVLCKFDTSYISHLLC